MIRENDNRNARTKANKDRRLARKLKEMERKRLKDNIDKFHYETKDGQIIKVKGGI